MGREQWMALASVEGRKERQGDYRDFESGVTFYFNEAVGFYAKAKRQSKSGELN